MSTLIGPATLVLVGIAGSLSKRLVLPALDRIVSSPGFVGPLRICGIDVASSAPNTDTTPALAGQISYIQGNALDAEVWRKAQPLLRRTIQETGGRCVIFPPFAGDKISLAMQNAGLADSLGNDGVKPITVVDKPVGLGLKTANEFLSTLENVWGDQFYSLDHYLGKAGARRILRSRRRMKDLEKIWSRKGIKCVEICLSESFGVGARGPFYDVTGATRDMIQSHALQLLCLVAMDLPRGKLKGDALQKAKLEVLRSIRPIKRDDVVLGQYGPGVLLGNEHPGYRDEIGRPDSKTETYSAMQMFVDNDRWRNVPFLIRTGKVLPRKAGHVIVHFKGSTFADYLVFQIGPEDGLLTSAGQKIQVPGDKHAGKELNGYELLLGGILQQDKVRSKWTISAEEIRSAWQTIDGVFEHHHPIHEYAAGSWGPPAADRLAQEAGLNCWSNVG